VFYVEAPRNRDRWVLDPTCLLSGPTCRSIASIGFTDPINFNTPQTCVKSAPRRVSTLRHRPYHREHLARGNAAQEASEPAQI
jgi:hypothetical protein